MITDPNTFVRSTMFVPCDFAPDGKGILHTGSLHCDQFTDRHVQHILNYYIKEKLNLISPWLFNDDELCYVNLCTGPDKTWDKAKKDRAIAWIGNFKSCGIEYAPMIVCDGAKVVQRDWNFLIPVYRDVVQTLAPAGCPGVKVGLETTEYMSRGEVEDRIDNLKYYSRQYSGGAIKVGTHMFVNDGKNLSQIPRNAEFIGVELYEPGKGRDISVQQTVDMFGRVIEYTERMVPGGIPLWFEEGDLEAWSPLSRKKYAAIEKAFRGKGCVGVGGPV